MQTDQDGARGGPQIKEEEARRRSFFGCWSLQGEGIPGVSMGLRRKRRRSTVQVQKCDNWRLFHGVTGFNCTQRTKRSEVCLNGISFNIVGKAPAGKLCEKCPLIELGILSWFRELAFYSHYLRDEGDLRASVSWRRKDGKPLHSGRRVSLERRAGRLSISGIRCWHDSNPFFQFL